VYAPESQLQIDKELQHADAARAEGNEGRARVCARRAVGAALRDVLRRKGAVHIPVSAFDLLRETENQLRLSERSRLAVERMVQKVDEEFSLPLGWDLIVEARMVIAELDTIV
jgi:hypothetical protein